MSLIGICNHHLCRKRTKVFICRFCKDFYCYEHRNPKKPAMFGHGDYGIGRSLSDEHRKPGHPDFRFAHYLDMKEKEKERRYEEAIEALTRRPAIKFEDKNPSHKIKETYWRHDTGVPKQHKKYTRFAKKLSTLAVIVIIGVVFFYFMKTGQLSTTLSSAQSLLENTTQNVVSSVDEQISRLPIRREIDVAKVETEIHNLINSQRQRYGLSPLSYDARLASIARAHSEDMVRRNFFDHVNPDGKDPTSRGIAASYSCYKDYGSYYTTGLAENLNQIPTGDVIGCGYVYTEEEITQCAVDGWMESLGHRQNILTATYDKEGIGVALSSGNVAYITQDFC